MPNSIKTRLQGEIQTDETANVQLHIARRLIKSTKKTVSDQDKHPGRKPLAD